jgi:Cdc6-like AAA superfamily ATPase
MPTAEEKRHYRNFVLELQYVLPCGKCRKNLAKNFKKLPLRESIMESRETFSKYIYDLHETVNRMLGKKSGLNFEKVRERYEHFRARCTKPLKRFRARCNSTTKRSDTGTAKRSDKGCVVPLYGNKAKCVLKIIPQDVKCETMQIDQSCIKRKGTSDS